MYVINHTSAKMFHPMFNKHDPTIIIMVLIAIFASLFPYLDNACRQSQSPIFCYLLSSMLFLLFLSAATGVAVNVVLPWIQKPAAPEAMDASNSFARPAQETPAPIAVEEKQPAPKSGVAEKTQIKAADLLPSGKDVPNEWKEWAPKVLTGRDMSSFSVTNTSVGQGRKNQIKDLRGLNEESRIEKNQTFIPWGYSSISAASSDVSMNC